MPFVTTKVAVDSIMLSEVSQRQILYTFTYMWHLANKQMNKQNKIETDPEIQSGGEVGMDEMGEGN